MATTSHYHSHRRHAHRLKTVPPVLLRRRRLGRTPVGGATINVDNPATGEIVGTVPKFGAAETRDAIEAADRAFPGVAEEDGQGARRGRLRSGST